jgi:alpha-L-rhamnosidase
MKNFSLSLLIFFLSCCPKTVSAQFILEKQSRSSFGWPVADFACNDSLLTNLSKQLPKNSIAYNHLSHTDALTTSKQQTLTDLLPLIGLDGYASYFLRTGDTASIRKRYPEIKLLLNDIDLDKKGLLKNSNPPEAFKLVEKDFDFSLLNNIWYYMALDGASLMASVTDNEHEVGEYQYRRQAFRDLFNESFWKDNTYKSGKNKTLTDDRANGLAIVAALPTSLEASQLTTFLGTNQRSTLYLEKYVLEGLFLLNENQEAIRRIKERIKNIATAKQHEDLSEQLWTSVYATLLSDYVAGIRPLEAAFSKVIIQPHMGTLTNINAHLNSPKGKINLNLEYNPDNNSLRMTVDIPTKCKGVISVPIIADIYKYITCNNRLIFSNQQYISHSLTELDLVMGNEHYLNFEVSKGGKYVFEAR